MNYQAFNFGEHPLRQADEHTQSLYLQLLLSVARVEEDTVFYDKMVDLTAAMLQEMESKLSLMQLAKSALSIDNAVLEDFAETLVIAGREQNFIVDAFMFSIISEGTGEKTLKYIVGLGSVLRLDQQQINELMQLAKIILEQDPEAFKNLCNQVLRIKVADFMMYSKTFTDLFVVNDMAAFKAGRYEDYENVVLANINISGEPVWDKISDLKKLLLINCRFDNRQLEYSIFDCENVMIKNCRFTNFSDGVLSISDCKQVQLLDCEFANCIQPVEFFTSESATLLLCDIDSVRITRCSFDNCHAIPRLSGKGITMEPSAAIAKIENVQSFRLKESKFTNCISTPKYKEKGVLFVLIDVQDCGKASACVRSNSCDIGDERLGKW